MVVKENVKKIQVVHHPRAQGEICGRQKKYGLRKTRTEARRAGHARSARKHPGHCLPCCTQPDCWPWLPSLSSC
ncbi:hypothetical protein V5799_012061 [Amblyomma americanum]|uniref:Uncharacterized protein n=1 Tax=Amblyomma americanum TaxID=6943 RepID=A0AAQ4EFG0_AMBAM